MNRQLLLAPFTAPDATDRLIAAILGSGVEPSGVLYLGPSPRKLRDAQFRFAQSVNRDAFIPPRFLTLFELARELHDQCGTTRRFRDELKPLLVQRLLDRGKRWDSSGRERRLFAEIPGQSHAPHRLRDGPGFPPGQSRVFSPLAADRRPSIGYCSAVARFIRDLKLSTAAENLDATRRIVAELLDPYEKPKARALEALDVLQDYDALLAQHGWSDDEGILGLAAGRLKAAEPIHLLVLDSFVSPSALELRLIDALLEQARAAVALCSGSADDDPAYRLGADFVRFLKSRAFTVTQLESAPARPEPPLFSFSSPEDEIAGICRNIKQRCLDGQLDISKTVVAFPSLAAVAPLAARLFQEYGIPATVYPAQSLAASPPIIAVLELLTALATDFERVATTAAFSSQFLPGLLRLSSDKGSSPRTSAALALNRAAYEAGIIQGKDSWQHLAEQLEPEHGFKDDEDERFARDLERRVRQAVGLVEKFLAEQRTLGGFAHALKQLLEAAKFCGNLDPDEPADAPLLEDRGELYDILDSLVGFEADFGAQQVGLAEFNQTLRYLVNSSQRGCTRPPRGVLVLSLPETLGLSPEHLYIGGLTESSLPARYPVDPLLPDWVRRRLGLPDIDWHRDHERFHFERTRHCSRSTPWLSYHAAADAKPVLPTPFLDLEPMAPLSAPGLYSPAEEQRYDGAAVGQTLPQMGQPAELHNDQDVLAALARQFGPNRTLSVTALEGYRACPYCFYLSNVLGLEPVRLPSLEIEPQVYGNIVHRALARLYQNGPVPLEQLKQTALDCLDEVIPEFGLNRFWSEVTRRLFENSLDDIVECETALRADGFTPAGTEITVAGPAGATARVKGRIDRYDSNGKHLRVLDYKTGSSGKVSARDIVENRTHLQLPVYSHLLQTERPGAKIDNMGIYMTRAAKVHWLANGDYPVAELIRAALENVAEIVRAIRAGEFPPTPANEESCESCPQSFLCGRSNKV